MICASVTNLFFLKKKMQYNRHTGTHNTLQPICGTPLATLRWRNPLAPNGTSIKLAQHWNLDWFVQLYTYMNIIETMWTQHITHYWYKRHNAINFMVVVPYILVICSICLIQVQLHVHYILYLFLDNVSSTWFGCYLHPSSGAQLPCTAIGCVWFWCVIPLEQLIWDSLTL
jgi:hypothetical protein